MKLFHVLILAGVVATVPVYGQFGRQVPASLPRYPDTSSRAQVLIISGGIASPLSRVPVTDFWSGGPSMSMQFAVAVNRTVELGVGFEGGMFRFEADEFVRKFPSVLPQDRTIYYGNVFMVMRLNLAPGRRVAPIIAPSLGVLKLSPAEYKILDQDSVRVTYYNIPGRFRLAGAVAAGLDVFFTKWLAFDLEARFLYAHHDTETGWTFSTRGGLLFRL